MTLDLVRMPVNMTALARAAGDRGWIQDRQSVFDEGAALHHLLGETFGPAVLQPFRLVVAPRTQRGTLYAYTVSEPATLRELAAATATPEAVAALSPGRLESKAMPTNWVAGRRLGIDVRLRPTRRLANDLSPIVDYRGNRQHGFKRGAEVDVFLAEALRNPERDSMLEKGRSRERVYRDWLQERFGIAAEIEDARLSAFRRTHSLRGRKSIEGPDAVIHGIIRITDSEAFSLLLHRGIGRHKTFGYGMLLLRPPAAPKS